MSNRICLDIESQFLFSEVGGRHNLHKLKVACAVIYEWRTNLFRTYDHTETEELKKRILEANEIVWYCGDAFDAPVIWERQSGMPPALVGKTNDIYRRICVAAGKNPNVGNRGFGLGPISEYTLNQGKIEDGKEAPAMFHSAQWGRLFRYCISDTALCRDLSDHIDLEGYVIGPRGVRIEVPRWKKTST